MTSNSPFLLELSTGLTSPFEKRTNDFPPPPGCPLPCGKRLSPLLTLELPQASKTGYSDHHNQTVLEIGTMTSPLLSHWSSGRSYNDPPLSPASSPATGSLYQGHLKLPDSCEPKPQLDQSIGKNCGCQLSSQSQVSGKPCFDPLLSWETDQSSYLFVTPGTVISGPPCPPESSLPQCPCSGLCYSSHLGNQFIAPLQSAPRRSYNEPPLPTPVSPQMKSPKFSDLRQQHILHKFPPCGTYGTPRGPPVLHCKPVAPPCSTHIYSFIPLRTPFDPQSLPIIPRARPYPDTIPCGLHNYSVASQGPSRVPLQIPYSCPLPSPKNSICSNDPSCSSSIVTSESHVNESNNRTVSKKKSNIKSPKHSESGSQSSSPYHSRSRSQSPQDNRNQSRGQSKVEDETESPQVDSSQDQSKSSDHGRSRKKSKSPRNGKSQGKSKSPQNKKKGQGRNKSPRQKKGRSKSPRTNKT
ncbi:sperm head and tail associated protein-like [Urocitellus parryii]